MSDGGAFPGPCYPCTAAQLTRRKLRLAQVSHILIFSGAGSFQQALIA